VREREKERGKGRERKRERGGRGERDRGREGGWKTEREHRSVCMKADTGLISHKVKLYSRFTYQTE